MSIVVLLATAAVMNGFLSEQFRMFHDLTKNIY